MQGYKDLIVWQKSIVLARELYVATENFPKAEQYGLCAQMRRCVVSIASNIAEGSKRRTSNDFRHFITMAYASGAELETQIEITKVLPFSHQCDFSKVEHILDEVMRMLNKLEHKLLLESKEQKPQTKDERLPTKDSPVTPSTPQCPVL